MILNLWQKGESLGQGFAFHPFVQRSLPGERRTIQLLPPQPGEPRLVQSNTYFVISVLPEEVLQAKLKKPSISESTALE